MLTALAMRAFAVIVLLSLACGCGSAGDESPSTASPAPSASVDSPPPPDDPFGPCGPPEGCPPPPPTPVAFTNPKPPPNPLAACTASQTGPCTLAEDIELTLSWPVELGATASDASAIDWSDEAAIHVVPKNGDAPSRLDVAHTAYGLASGAYGIYFTNPLENVAMRIPSGGGAPVPITTNLLREPSAIAIDATRVYFVDGRWDQATESDVGTLFWASPTGGPASVVSANATCLDLALDDTSVYCRTQDDAQRFPRDGGAPTTLVTSSSLVRFEIAMNEQTIFVAGDAWYAIPKAGGPMTTLGNAGDAAYGPVATSDALYAIGSLGATVVRVPLDGSPSSTIPTTGYGFTGRLMADATNLYWVDYVSACLAGVQAGGFTQSCSSTYTDVRVVRAPLVF